VTQNINTGYIVLYYLLKILDSLRYDWLAVFSWTLSNNTCVNFRYLLLRYLTGKFVTFMILTSRLSLFFLRQMTCSFAHRWNIQWDVRQFFCQYCIMGTTLSHKMKSFGYSGRQSTKGRLLI